MTCVSLSLRTFFNPLKKKDTPSNNHISDFVMAFPPLELLATHFCCHHFFMYETVKQSKILSFHRTGMLISFHLSLVIRRLLAYLLCWQLWCFKHCSGANFALHPTPPHPTSPRPTPPLRRNKCVLEVIYMSKWRYQRARYKNVVPPPRPTPPQNFLRSGSPSP